MFPSARGVDRWNVVVKILLLAYEFPPVLAAQSLRWSYLANELARRGVTVDVLAPAIRDRWGFTPDLVPGVRVLRCFPGPFVALTGWLSGSLGGGGPPGLVSAGVKCAEGERVDQVLAMPPAASPGTTNLTARAERGYRWLRGMLDQVIFPDLRTEWLPFAWRAARRLGRDYDLVISSHEPGVDLLLGLRIKRAWGLPWIVDLADPLVAPHAPAWRRPWDERLEGRVCREADAVLVTNLVVGDRLARNHGVERGRFHLIRQGFDAHPPHEDGLPVPPWPADQLVLLFTGTLYHGFREPGALLEALAVVEGVQLVLLGEPGPFAADLGRLGPRVMLLGKLPHAWCLAWQRRADLLLNIGNRQADQVPGKIYEYLGAGRPILHIAANPADPVPALLARLGRGRGVTAAASAVASALRELRDRWRAGRLDEAFDLSLEPIGDYSWTAEAGRLHALMAEVLARSSQPPRSALHRLLVVGEYSDVTVGGAERYRYETVTRLRARGLEVLELYADGGEVGAHGGAGSEMRVSRPWRLFSGGYHPSWWDQIDQILRLQRPDLIYAHLTVPGLVDVVVRRAATVGIPICLVYHGDVTGIDWVRRLMGQIYHRLVRRGTLRCTGTLVVGSPAYLAASPWLAELTDCAIYFAPPGVDEVMARGRCQSGQPYYLFVGKAGVRAKGFQILYQAWLRQGGLAAGIGLKVAGPVPVKSFPGVEFLGCISDRERLADLYASALATVLPSLTMSESYGMALAEALVAGCPVIGSRIGGIPTLVIEDENGFLVPPGSVTDLAIALGQVLHHQERLRSNLRRNRARLAREYGWGLTTMRIHSAMADAARIRRRPENEPD